MLGSRGLAQSGAVTGLHLATLGVERVVMSSPARAGVGNARE